MIEFLTRVNEKYVELLIVILVYEPKQLNLESIIYSIAYTTLIMISEYSLQNDFFIDEIHMVIDLYDVHVVYLYVE